jgi:hypothetical protein
MNMTLQFNLNGAERKTLVTAISQILETPAVYLKTPSYAYQVGEYHIDKFGTLTGPDNADLQDLLHQNGFCAEEKTYVSEETADDEEATETEPTFEELDMTMEEELGLGRQRREDPQGENGMSVDDVPEFFDYRAELSDPDCEDRMEMFNATDDEDAIRQAYAYTSDTVLLLELHQMDEDYNIVRHIDLPPNPYRLTVEVPLEGFTPEKLDILCKMVTAKETLLKAALGVETLPIQVREDSIRFPWFWSENILTAEEVEAYSTFISLLCTTAKEKKRVNGKEKQSDSSPKFLMRVFLLSLGGIGKEYKNMRKVLLSKLSGSSAWPKGAPTKLALTAIEKENLQTETATEVQA